MSDSWIFALWRNLMSIRQHDSHMRTCTPPPSFLSVSFCSFCHRTPVACVRHFPRALTLLLFYQHPASSPTCLRNQTQVCHCWGSNRGNPQAQLQKEPLKTTLSTVLATQPATNAGGREKTHTHTPSLLPACFSSSQILHFTQLASSLSALNVPQLNSSTPPAHKRSHPLLLSSDISVKPGKIGREMEPEITIGVK